MAKGEEESASAPDGEVAEGDARPRPHCDLGCYDKFDRYRRYVEHEDGLINHRTTWLVAVQAFLIGVVGITFQQKAELLGQTGADGDFATQVRALISSYFILLFSVAGVLTADNAKMSINAAHDAIANLGNLWGHVYVCDKCGFELPALTGGGAWSATVNGIKLAQMLPVLLGRFWLAVYALAVADAAVNIILYAVHCVKAFVQ